MAETADRIIDVMAELIQSRGYSAVSYQDISEAVGIRKASIHYHFPSKADLGVAVIKAYAKSLMEQLKTLDTDSDISAKDKLEAYFSPYVGFKGDDRRVCLCGALAGEFFALPDDMQAEVTSFFAEQQAWLEKLFESNKDEGVFRLPGTPKQTARLFFDALQGSLLAKRASDDDSQIDDVVETLKVMVL